jgi:hypothetical protein
LINRRKAGKAMTNYKVSVKEMATQASACLTISGHGAMGLDNQALAGAMKPNLVRALIQRGALR